jgi:hypothetical protein
MNSCTAIYVYTVSTVLPEPIFRTLTKAAERYMQTAYTNL